MFRHTLPDRRIDDIIVSRLSRGAQAWMVFEMTHVLITGGAGMIGSNLTRRLVAAGVRVTIVDNLWRGRLDYLAGVPADRFDLDRDFHRRDLSRPGALDDLLGGVEYVFHLADIVAGIGFVFANELTIFRQNLLINTHVVESVARAGAIKGYIYPGTACSFPRELQTGVDARPLREDDMLPASPESAYGWSKLMGLYEAELLEKEHGVPVGLPVLHNVYGGPCDYSAERSQVLPALVARAVAYRAPGDFVVWGDGGQGRAFVHVDDVVDALIATMERGLGHGIIQIGPDQCTSIRTAAEAIVRASGKAIRIDFDLTKPTGDRGRCADYAKARDVLGWAPRTDFEDGVSRLYEWIATSIAADRAAAV